MCASCCVLHLHAFAWPKTDSLKENSQCVQAYIQIDCLRIHCMVEHTEGGVEERGGGGKLKGAANGEEISETAIS